MLDRYLGEHKSDIRPDLYNRVKQKVRAYQKKLKDTQVVSVDEHSTNEGYWNRTLEDFRPLRYRYRKTIRFVFRALCPTWMICYSRLMNFRLIHLRYE